MVCGLRGDDDATDNALLNTALLEYQWYGLARSSHHNGGAVSICGAKELYVSCVITNRDYKLLFL